jgi:TonB family protein
MKKIITHQTKYTYKTLLFSLGILFTVFACEDAKKTETPVDTLAVVAVDTPKVVGNGNGGNGSTIPQDTVTAKIDTPAKVETPKEVVKETPKEKSKEKTKDTPKEMVKETPKEKPKEKKVKEAEPKDLVKTPDQPAMPPNNSYPGFYKFVRENLKYPEQAIKDGVEGTVRVEFVVDKDGGISHVKVVQGIGAGCDEEAIRIVKQSPKWIAGIYKGNPVTTKSLIPISFKLK